ncbi:uncharacterized protein LOC124926031 [Impatiens glandulifera]|uniref:uncharacterized protein LOC124926031 n=1 Tax=Impatiens glandulifera TaxID=253017 RepID=UPI001FB0F65B|nr:uncharacterized protein LOC124926031 [Impatiens glandulifera]
MAANSSDNRTNYTNHSLVPEIGPDGLARDSPVIAYTEKLIEQEQLQLRKYIEENYSKIRDVEKELTNLTLEMKLTAGPKKAALEHMRKKIEASTERLRLAKLNEQQTKKAWETASQAVKDEEALKQKLCEDLNNLVQESNNAQYGRLEELKRRLGALNPSRSSTSVTHDTNSTGSQQNSQAQHASSMSSSSPSGGGGPEKDNQGNSGNAAIINGQNQESPPMESEGKMKKKPVMQGRGRGIGGIKGSRPPAGTGWTGAGFD